MVLAGVALDPVRERVHAGGCGDGGREAEHEGRVDQGDVSPDKGRAADVELDPAPVVSDNSPERHLATGPRSRRDRHERRYAPRNRGLALLVVEDGAAVRHLDAEALASVHRAAAA